MATQVTDKNPTAIGKKFSLGPMTHLIDDGKLLISMVKDYWNKEYRAVPYWVIGATVSALLYVLSPVDLIPDFIPGVGYIDDAAVVSACLRMIRKDLARYREWKRSAPTESHSD
jgi:uncharacterized membrane protein YkvA (DUF1232 family)